MTRTAFAESTIQATLWLICWSYDHDRVARWLNRHPNGKQLEQIAWSRIKHKYAVAQRNRRGQ